ncbi:MULTISPECIES: glycosyltransferase family 4 protein [Pseudomonas]|jgi:glycosyltransferase involved in cell wall biosynthesis|uniref:Glycosyltransferase family 4 protein n=2 Tax=Pseudomonas fluorescens group TaxID=136843 RepID=A0AB36D3G2_9PSED|nr:MULTISPECIES: glycosyltransferase family 4 protein [Pseudomonas]MBU0521375.1 glycosyltransferase family 4 protein [Gammaproteobacteria bacterium]MBU0820815.1 glycosyltransferase family 4 protein [Gammaproteobacteria bacterium]MBU0841389.1 glycosyltransferase family 4 protein [Gammaproteobacteria bacterium]MBU1840514.1 glycosyltransferase family 4 protein [Gammaproteobacteria bacterium]NMZ83063.1 glycosyltransferase family 4 protein [Pseudomonas mandelii]
MPESKLRILVVTQYFWPENMRINDLVRDFTEKGHSVTVLTGLPNYPEGKVFEEYKASPGRFNHYFDAKVVRVPMLARGKRSISLVLNYFSFFTSASTIGAFKLRGEKFDAVFVYAVSPIMAAIPALVMGRIKKAPVFVWVLDLWPETLRAVGVLKHPALLSMVGKMVSWIYNRTDYLLLQSHGFFENVKKYCTKDIASQRMVYFPSWAEDDFSSSAAHDSTLLPRDNTVFTVVFAGNLGEAQDLPAVLDAAEELRDKVVMRWVIVGDGRMSEWLSQQVHSRGLNNVLLLGRHPLEEMPGLFASADALLVSLKTNDVFEKTIPGKVQAYLASGRPLLGMINGEAARVIDDSGAGFTCASGDASGLASITLALAKTDAVKLKAMGQSGRQYYLSNYSKPLLLARLEDLFRNATLRKATR